MGSVGDRYDDALAESFFATLETELIDPSEVLYDRIRRHSSLGNLSPERFEQRYRSRPAAMAV
jgi:putative transposase